jgi:hypothetical protein
MAEAQYLAFRIVRGRLDQESLVFTTTSYLCRVPETLKFRAALAILDAKFRYGFTGPKLQ